MIVLLFLIGCGDSHPKPRYLIEEGPWRFAFNTQGAELPIQANVSHDGTKSNILTFINGAEQIDVNPLRFVGDTIFYDLPIYQSSLYLVRLSPDLLEGVWTDLGKDDYHIPFMAEYGKDFRFTPTNSSTAVHSSYAVQFTESNGNQYPALLLLENNQGELTGTFLTETGDYRFLAGNIMNNQVHLSAFDGSHLWHFYANIIGDTLSNGVFTSGSHYKSFWTAYRSEENTLSDPWSITQPSRHDSLFQFTFLSKDSVVVSSDDFDFSPVNIFAISGSWCPNCADAAIALQQLASQFKDSLGVHHVYFERSNKVIEINKRVKKLVTQLGLSPKYYIGGSTKTDEVAQVLSAIGPLRSYPTLIFTNQSGKIQAIYTGFYGPGTGEYYDQFMRQASHTIRSIK